MPHFALGELQGLAGQQEAFWALDSTDAWAEECGLCSHNKLGQSLVPAGTLYQANPNTTSHPGVQRP